MGRPTNTASAEGSPGARCHRRGMIFVGNDLPTEPTQIRYLLVK